MRDDPNAENSRLSTCNEGSRQEQFRRRDERAIFSKHWENFPTISPVCGGDDGLPSELDGITFPKWRKESIKAYGNAIVPQVAYQLFQAIKNTKSLAF
jgi:DNA (cytosine-5)-methyltransferase 1